MTDESYNGWTNYPTWAVALWLDNDEGTSAAVAELVADWNEQTSGDEGGTVTDLADAIREYVESLPDVDAVTGSAGLAADLLGFALSAADWHQLARTFALEAVGTDAELDRRKARYLAAILTR